MKNLALIKAAPRKVILHSAILLATKLTPLIISLLIMILLTGILGLPGMSHVIPLSALCSVFYWSIYRPDMMPYWTALIIGLFQDSIQGMPFGVSAVACVLMKYLIQEKYNYLGQQNFKRLWLGFSILLLIPVILTFAIMVAFFGGPLTAGAVFYQWLLTCFLYPSLHYLFNKVYQKLPRM